jgi:acetoacetate decarboxylase
MFKIDPDQSYMMPIHFGPRLMGEKVTGWYHDVTMMIVSYLTDRKKLETYLPPPFEVAKEPIVTVTYACNKKIDWLAGHGYNLISVDTSVVFNGQEDKLAGNFILVLWENLTDPILTGREMRGLPKIYADIPDHRIMADEWRTNASHFGHKILDISVSNLKMSTSGDVESGQKVRNDKDNWMGWRFLPDVNGFGQTVNEATLYPSESVYEEIWIGEGKIEWNRLTWEQNPTQYHIVNALADLPIFEHRPAIMTKGSTNLFIPDRSPRVLR